MTDDVNRSPSETLVQPGGYLSLCQLNGIVGGAARDAAAGLATGKRMHKPFGVTISAGAEL